jgi:hypothetical protein
MNIVESFRYDQERLLEQYKRAQSVEECKDILSMMEELCKVFNTPSPWGTIIPATAEETQQRQPPAKVPYRNLRREAIMAQRKRNANE